MLCFSTANQGTIIYWVRDHRVHHKYPDTDADPYNAKRGFFFAHMGWLFVKKHTDVVTAGSEIDFSDLYDDKLVMFQKRWDPWFQWYMCFIMPAQVASYFWGEDFSDAFLVAGGVRYIVLLHVTWLVNSASHFHGDHPYDSASSATENPIVSFCTGGEGWHNWHHKYPYDYAAAEFGISAQYNVSKLMIDVAAWLGLVWNRKRGYAGWVKHKARRAAETTGVSSAPTPAPKVPATPSKTD
jgi:stearoyl-CoA desaturase (delta-9 desaturase)